MRTFLISVATAAVASASMALPAVAVDQGQRCQKVGDASQAGGIRLECSSAFTWQYSGPANDKQRKHCVIVDNDYDIDDMMAIPLVLGGKHVAAIVQSEGYTLSRHAAPAADHLVNHGRGKSRQIPIIVGGQQTASPDLRRWPWLPFFRSMMNRSNGLLTVKPAAWGQSARYPRQVARSVSNCESVSILIIGTYTSFNKYLPLIKDKVDRVVIMGQPIGDYSRTPGRESFNCNFDFAACQAAMSRLEQLHTFFVDIPRFSDCHNGTPAAHCYSPNREMVAGVMQRGLPGRLRKALMNDISCAAFYTTPQTQGHPCSSRSTWEPSAVAKGPGGEMLLWDQTAAMFLLRPDAFSRYYPADDPGLGGQHYEPTLVDGSDARTVDKLRRMWTRLTNKAVRTRAVKAEYGRQ